MTGSTKRRIGGVAITGLVIAGVIGVTSMSASGEFIEATDPVIGPFGTLTIELNDRGGSVNLTLDGETTPSISQQIATQQPCNALGFVPLPLDAGDLLAITPIVNGATTSADTVQLPGDALGVNSGTNCGNPAGLIGPGEKMEFALGAYFDDLEVLSESATLVIDKQFNNSGNLTVGYDDGGQGSPIGIANGGETLVVEPADPFTSITLASTSNKSSRGLSVGNLTSFDLVTTSSEFEVAVDCGETVTQIGDSGTIATNAQYFRGENGVKQVGECVQVGAIVEIESDDGGRVFWNNATIGVDGSTQDVAGTITIDWAPVAAENPSELDRQIDFDATGPGVYVDVPWCLSFSSTTDVDGKVTFDAVLPVIGIGTPGANPDGTAPWCLVSNEEVLNGAGEIVQTQVYFGSGDPWAR